MELLVIHNPTLSVPTIMDAMETFANHMGIRDSPRFLANDQYYVMYRAREIVRREHFGSCMRLTKRFPTIEELF